MIATYSITAPLGIAIGIGVASSYNEKSIGAAASQVSQATRAARCTATAPVHAHCCKHATVLRHAWHTHSAARGVPHPPCARRACWRASPQASCCTWAWSR